MKNYVIIGGGVASVACIEGIRQTDKSGKIYLISGEGKPTYCRPLISYYLQGITDFKKMKYRPDGFYAENNCELIFGKAEKVDAKNKTVKVGNKTIKYDSLCVATGSSPFVPPFNGLDTVENKTAFMTEDDALYIEEKISSDTKVLIIGAGLIGLKCAEGLVGKVKSITVSDLATRVLSPLLLTGKNLVLVMKRVRPFRRVPMVVRPLPSTAVLRKELIITSTSSSKNAHLLKPM